MSTSQKISVKRKDRSRGFYGESIVNLIIDVRVYKIRGISKKSYITIAVTQFLSTRAIIHAWRT